MPSNAAELTQLMMTERSTLVRSVERILGNRSDAEEVAQSLWLKIQHVSDHPPIIRKRAFLFRLARNLALDWKRGDQRRVRLHDAAQRLLSEVDESPGQDRIVDSLVMLRRVRAAALELPEPTRTIFHLNRFEGATHKMIAEQIGVSTTTVENHIRRALDRLAVARDGLG
jgi:RNA polymerase sigma-70 factor (ECF subfamily)